MNDREATRRFYDATAEQLKDDWFRNPALLPTLTAFMGHLLIGFLMVLGSNWVLQKLTDNGLW